MFLTKTTTLVVPLSAVLSYCVIYFLSHLDINKRVYNHVPGECSQLLHDEHQRGAANLDTFDDVVVFSSGSDINNATNATGTLLYWRYGSREIGQVSIEGDIGQEFKFNPHGLSFYMNQLVAVTTLNGMSPNDRIDIFNVVGSKQFKERKTPFFRIKYASSISNSEMTGLRGIVAVGRDRFYVANQHRFRSKPMQAVESFFKLSTGSIFYYDGKKLHVAAQGLATPTGLAYDRSKRHLYVTCHSAMKIVIFKASFQNLTKINEIQLQTAPYSITFDPFTLQLLITAHPIKLRYFLYDFDPFSYFAPSQVLQLKRRKKRWSITQLYVNDGATISAATSAIMVFPNEKPPQLIIGNVYDSLLACELTAV